MKRLLLKFERRTQPVISLQQFIIRLAHSGFISLILIAFSLLIGMVGYHVLENLNWIDAFLNASMLLGGMGPVNTHQPLMEESFLPVYMRYIVA